MFIILEGIDGAGHTTQAQLLKDYFHKNKIDFFFFKTPNKDTPIGSAFYSYLNKDYDADTEAVFLLCASDVIMNKKGIIESLYQGRLVLGERYITSTLAYQAANGFDFKKGVKIIKMLEYPKADMIFYLDISVEKSMERRLETGKLDRHEEDENYLKKVKFFYKKQMRMNFLGEWVRINAEKGIEETKNEIIKHIENKIKIK
jgi:dTMP kinase